MQVNLTQTARRWHCALLVFAISISYFFAPASRATDIGFPIEDYRIPIQITGKTGATWKQGFYEIWQIQDCHVRQGRFSAKGNSAVIWIDRALPETGGANKVIVYLEGEETRIEQQVLAGLYPVQSANSGTTSRVLTDTEWLGRLVSTTRVSVNTKQTTPPPRIPPAIVQRARNAWQASHAGGPSRVSNAPAQPNSANTIQFAAYQNANPDPSAEPNNRDVSNTHREAGLGKHRLRLEGRSTVDASLHIEQDPAGGGSLAIAKSGIRIRIEELQLAAEPPSRQVTIETDSMVLWGPPFDQLRNNSITDSTMPIEVYLEGNIIFRQGDREIHADRMYYNVTNEYGMILNAEILTPLTEYEGLMRVKADILQQVNRQTFRAYGVAITSSQMGIPTYWLQSDEVEITDHQEPSIDPLTGEQLQDAESGVLQFNHEITAHSKDNFLFLGGIPVFYWPVMGSRIDSPAFYLDRVRVKIDRVYGQQLLLDWNAFQLFNVQEIPKNSTWSLSTDLMSERGVALGTLYEYQRDDMFRLPGISRGKLDVWGLQDQGRDNLGRDRRNVSPEKEFRGNIFWQHRQLFGDGYQITGEAGLISDRNFMEQFFEQVWDQEKDQMTRVELKRITDNQAWSIGANIRVNDFFTQTDWLPKLDHYWLGESILGDRLSWYEHTSVGFAQLKPASTPVDVAEQAKFDLMAGEEQKYSGLRVATRHELDFPVQWGNVKIVPYLLGEAAYWGNDITNNDVTRTYGQVGIRSNLPMSRIDRNIKSTLFNVNGLAHKVNWTLDAYWADASENMDRFPRYDALDDDAQEHFRRRFFFDTFGGLAGQNIAAKWDERLFAYRANMQGLVTSPVTEVADDTMTFRLATEHRWQTKRGIPGKEHIVDWMVLNAEMLFFPDSENNVGQHVGMFDYDYRWHIGDRFTLLSDGYFDFFGGGLRTASIGGVISRPENGRFFVGYRMIDGPISSHIFNAALSYKMSQKWIAIVGSSFDLGDTGNIGQSLSLVRIGESFLVRVGVNYDESRNNIGMQITIEPRFIGNNRIARLTGIQTPPVGTYGLE